MPKITLSIVIVNYKTPQLVIDNLASLLPEIVELEKLGASVRALVVDNQSADDSLQKISQWLAHRPDPDRERVSLLQSSINGGFSAGNNFGLRAQQAEFYLLLNSDTIVRPGSIRLLLKSMQQQPSVGIMGPRLEFLDGHPQESCFREQGVISEFLRGAKFSLADKILKNYVVAIPVGDTTTPIRWISFACALIRGTLVDEIGLMDEKYFMYFEDSEFCMRARKAGWQLGHEPEARVVHLRGGSSSVKRRAVQKKRLPGYFYHSRSQYFIQSGGPPEINRRQLPVASRSLPVPVQAFSRKNWRGLGRARVAGPMDVSRE